MQSLKELYKIGNGPSSSHTMGPKRATELFKNKYQNADKFKIIDRKSTRLNSSHS